MQIQPANQHSGGGSVIEIAAFVSFAALVIVWVFAPNAKREAEKPAAAPASSQEVLA
jgi:hypothetical protein